MRISMLVAMTVFFFAAVVSAGAKEHFINGQEYYDQGRYKEAIDEFQKAYDMDARPLLLFNIAQAYEKLGNLPKSVDYLKQFLKKDTAKTDTKTVENKIANLEARIAKTGISVECSEADAAVSVDGTAVGSTPVTGVIPLPEGMHEVTIQKEGFQTFKMNVGVSMGYAVPVFAKMEPGNPDTPVVAAAAAAEGPAENQNETKPAAEEDNASAASDEDAGFTDQAPAEEKSKDPGRVVPWVLTGVGAVTAVVGFGVFGGMAVANDDTTKAHIADAVGFSGAALAVAGLTWGIVHLVKSKKEASQAKAFALPFVAGRSAGLAATVEF